MTAKSKKSVFAAGWRSISEAGPQRLVVTALLLALALLLARYSWDLPFTNNAERALYDSRVYELAEEVEQDQRLAIVRYTDQTLIQLQKRSPLDRGLLAQALRQIDTMNPKAIGIDILFDQPQEEDAELIEVLRGLNAPSAIAFVSQENNEYDIIYEQEQNLAEFLAQLEGSKARPASVRLNNSFGVTRIWPEIIEGQYPLIGRVMLEDGGDADKILPGYEGAIRYRLPAVDRESVGEDGSGAEVQPLYAELDIDLFAKAELLATPEFADSIRAEIEGRYVLIGSDLVDFDRVTTPLTATIGFTPPGVEIHAELIAQMLDEAPLPKPSPFYIWFIALATIGLAVLTGLLEMKSWKIIPLLAIQLGLLAGLPYFLHARGLDTYEFPAIGPALGWVVAFAAIVSAARASGAVQRRFAQGALGKYLPQSIADEIIEKPELLQLGGAKREIYVIFSDLEGFTKMSHALEPEMVAKLLNRYLEMLSKVVLDHGGILDKFVGDAVVAFWGAPISRPDDADRAAKAGYALWQAGEDFRKEVAAMDPNLPPIGKTRVGMHFGEAVVGNFGGENRIQYTALGDSMNTAARLESANKALKTSVMASEDFASRTSLDWWRPMGKVVLSGRKRPVALLEPAPDFADDAKRELSKALEMLDKDQDSGLKMLEEICAKHPGDEGLADLVRRSADLDEAGAHVMAGK